jgi:hypothetical protein
MELAILVVSCLCLLASVTSVVLAWRAASPGGDGLNARARRRVSYARAAVAYARSLGGTPEAQLRGALHHFALLDEADNGRRDYSDAEARLSIESVRGEVKP